MNQKLDDHNRAEVLKSLGNRLDLIVDMLSKRSSEPTENEPEYLDRHLLNA